MNDNTTIETEVSTDTLVEEITQDADWVPECVEADGPVGGITDTSEVQGYDPEFKAACKTIALHAEKAFDSTSAFREILLSGESTEGLLLKERARKGDAFKREETIKLIGDVTATCSRLSRATIKPNDWIRALKATLVTFGVQRVKDLKADQIRNLSYSVVSIVSRLLDRDANEVYSVSKENITLFREVMDSHVNGTPDRLYGKALRERIDAHEKALKDDKEASRVRGMSPEKVESEEKAERIRAEGARQSKRTRAAVSLLEAFNSTGLTDPEDIARVLMDKEVIPKSIVKTERIPLDLASFALTMSTQDALALVESLAKNNRQDVLATLFRRIKDILVAADAKRKSDDKAALEGSALRVAM